MVDRTLRPLRDHIVVGGVTLVALLGFILLLVPVGIVLALSFTSGQTLRFPPPGWSTQWYQALFSPEQSGYIHQAALNSFLVAIASTLLGILVALPAALGLRRMPVSSSKAWDLFFTSPLILPLLAYGLAALIFFGAVGLPPSLATMVIGHAVVTAPLILRTTYASVLQLDPALLESSEVLGASRLHTFRRVTLPLVAPGVAAGAFLAFVFSFDNVPVSLFLATPTTDMLPIRLWGMMEVALDVRIAAVSGVLIVLTTLLLLAAERLFNFSRHVA